MINNIIRQARDKRFNAFFETLFTLFTQVCFQSVQDVSDVAFFHLFFDFSFIELRLEILAQLVIVLAVIECFGDCKTVSAI